MPSFPPASTSDEGRIPERLCQMHRLLSRLRVLCRWKDRRTCALGATSESLSWLARQFSSGQLCKEMPQPWYIAALPRRLLQ